MRIKSYTQRKAEKRSLDALLHTAAVKRTSNPAKLTQEEISRRKEKASAFVGKKVIAGKQLGIGVRVHAVHGSLVVSHGRTEISYNPDFVDLA